MLMSLSTNKPHFYRADSKRIAHLSYDVHHWDHNKYHRTFQSPDTVDSRRQFGLSAIFRLFSLLQPAFVSALRFCLCSIFPNNILELWSTFLHALHEIVSRSCRGTLHTSNSFRFGTNKLLMWKALKPIQVAPAQHIWCLFQFLAPQYSVISIGIFLCCGLSLQLFQYLEFRPVRMWIKAVEINSYN